MILTKIRYGIEAFLFLVLLTVFRVLPLDAASSVGGFIGRVIGPRLAASRKARRHINLALPEKTPQEIDQIITGMWDNLGRVVAEYPHLRKIAQHRLTVRGSEYIDAALGRDQVGGDNKDSGAVFFCLHMGNWEIPPVYLHVMRGVDIHSLYRAPNNPYVDRMILRLRTLGGALGAWNKSRAGGMGAMKALRAGGSIAILIDQKYNEGINIPFFGRDAMTNPFFVTLAKKFDAPLVPATLKRTGGAHFELTVYPPLPVEERSDSEVIAQAHSILEAAIREAPEQWLWLHRRWRDGE